MELVNRNTAGQLYEIAESLSQQPHDSWKCVYLKLSDKKSDLSHPIYASFIVKALDKLLAEKEGTIYVCDDHDILILFQGALKPVLSSLSGHFGDVDIHQARVLKRGSLLHLYNLRTHWDDFYSLCENKHLQALAASENARLRWTGYAPAANIRL